MGIVKISEELHEVIRKASSVMVRSINAQAEFWIKIGMLAESNPTMSFSEIMSFVMGFLPRRRPCARATSSMSILP